MVPFSRCVQLDFVLKLLTGYTEFGAKILYFEEVQSILVDVLTNLAAISLTTSFNV